jgi:hypothetical protein
MYQHEDFANYVPAHPMLKADTVVQHSPITHYHGPVATGAQHIHYHFHGFEDSAGLGSFFKNKNTDRANKLFKDKKFDELVELYKLGDGSYDWGDSVKSGGVTKEKWLEEIKKVKKRPDLPTKLEYAAALARKAGKGALAGAAIVGGAVVGGAAGLGKGILKAPGAIIQGGAAVGGAIAGAFTGEEPTESDEQF